jgi:hypothetical protein
VHVRAAIGSTAHDARKGRSSAGDSSCSGSLVHASAQSTRCASPAVPAAAAACGFGPSSPHRSDAVRRCGCRCKAGLRGRARRIDGTRGGATSRRLIMQRCLLERGPKRGDGRAEQPGLARTLCLFSFRTLVLQAMTRPRRHGGRCGVGAGFQLSAPAVSAAVRARSRHHQLRSPPTGETEDERGESACLPCGASAEQSSAGSASSARVAALPAALGVPAQMHAQATLVHAASLLRSRAAAAARLALSAAAAARPPGSAVPEGWARGRRLPCRAKSGFGPAHRAGAPRRLWPLGQLRRGARAALQHPGAGQVPRLAVGPAV